MIPNFSKYLEEGMLTNYRTERDGQKLGSKDLKMGFLNLIKKLIEERIPFYFDCQSKDNSRIGYLMNDSINGENFNGIILGKNKIAPEKEIEKIMEDGDITVIKPGKLHIGRSIFADLTQANDLDSILVVVKAFKSYKKDKNVEGRVITGNKYEVVVNIDFICDPTSSTNIIDYVF